MQFHKICLIGQDDLPAGYEWAVVEHDGRITIFITQAALTPEVLEEAWAGYRLLVKPSPPRQRPMMPPLLNTA